MPRVHFRVLAVSLSAVVTLAASGHDVAAQAGGVTSPAGQAAEGGVWWGLSVGAAGTRLTCDLCQPSRDLGPAVHFSFGSYATPELRVGLELGGWTHEEDESREKVYRGAVVANLRPNLERGAYLVGSFGWSSYRAGAFHYDAPSVALGIGWDAPLGQNARIGNQLTLDASSFGSLKNGDTSVARNVGMSLVRFAVQLHRL